MTTLEILTSAREKISDESRWTTEAYARSRDGRIVSWSAPDAVCWCAQGAVRSETDGIDINPGLSAIGALCLALPGLTLLSEFNDSCTHAEVLALFDKAIADAQG